MSEENKPVVAWVRIPGIGRVHQKIDIPDDCFDADGDIIKEDAVEFVEKWMQDTLQMEYGVCKREEEMPIEMDLSEAIYSAKSLMKQLNLLFLDKKHG